MKGSFFLPAGRGPRLLVAVSIMMSAACQRGISVAGALFGSATPAPSHIRRFVSGSYHVASVTGGTAVGGRALVCGQFFCLCRVRAACGDFLGSRHVGLWSSWR